MSDEDDHRREAHRDHRGGGAFGFLKELPGLILVAFALALLIKSLLVQAFYIPSSSMENTLLIGDRVLVNKMVYRFREPRRGDVVVFERGGDSNQSLLRDLWEWATEGLGFSADPQEDFIKRIIALPGETFEYRRGKVFIDGKRIQEPYLHPQRDAQDYPPTTVPGGHFWVMGDNRANSTDSRSFRAVPRDRIVGRAFVILWPAQRFAWLGAAL